MRAGERSRAWPAGPRTAAAPSGRRLPAAGRGAPGGARAGPGRRPARRTAWRVRCGAPGCSERQFQESCEPDDQHIVDQVRAPGGAARDASRRPRQRRRTAAALVRVHVCVRFYVCVCVCVFACDCVCICLPVFLQLPVCVVAGCSPARKVARAPRSVGQCWFDGGAGRVGAGWVHASYTSASQPCAAGGAAGRRRPRASSAGRPAWRRGARGGCARSTPGGRCVGKRAERWGWAGAPAGAFGRRRGACAPGKLRGQTGRDGKHGG